jgi:NAD(P)-dependent dehydrogenase (short-subunit alcohol dehydrogenase family)
MVLLPLKIIHTDTRNPGIGFAVATAFAEAGCTRIILIDLNTEGLKAASKKLWERYPKAAFITSTVDISEPGAMEKALEVVITENNGVFNRLDYAVNCAGMNGINASHAPTNSTETSLEYFDKLNGINYRGTWMANRAYLNVMLKQEPPFPTHGKNPKRLQRGSIVNLSSGLGLIGMPKNRKPPSFFLIKHLRQQNP